MSAATAPRLRLRSDAHLLRRFRAGDDGAFAVLHGRHADPIRRYVAGMLRGTAHDADDATQDVFVRAFESLRRDARPVELRPWLFRVAHNRCVDVLRRPAAGAFPAGTDTLAAPAGAEPAVVTETRDALRALLRDIGALPDRQRSALLLREVGGLSHEAVAEALDVTPGASKMLVARARVALAEAASARDAVCADVRQRLALAADEARRPDRVDRLHLRGCADCAGCAQRLDRVHRELALIPAGGAGLIGLLASVAGGAGAKSAVVASCAVVCVGGATSVLERPQPAKVPPPRAAERAQGPDRPASVPPKRTRAPRAAPAARPVTRKPAPEARPAQARPAAPRETVEVAAVSQAAVAQTPPAAPAPAPAPAPAEATPAPPAPVERETIDLADLGG